MNPAIVSEAWQAMSILSDAQEVLEAQRTTSHRINAADDHINHAKAHLQQLFDLARTEDRDAFFKGTLIGPCTLQHGPPSTQIIEATLQDVPQAFDQEVLDDSA